ncbi:MAG: M3 family oligoendopeptidase [Bacteroidota bacterium]|nr:M3 family oligoendopeptidase [Candidatus Kapabacteria bacterium]MCS7302533.1 M3 family oligoendopeptidase [Candidatus Kapabacteria bacterium]MCX7936781.1 M3 family oligoendopeptidase [Chlorobiota bacterium]MDW8074175.1 M3 family oligoendopeptidase [Bacteroidota bacterium]MDW8271349.1 M3 family oligoendopeptidase [Bacteroidota bacterium]
MTTHRSFETFSQLPYERPNYETFSTEWNTLLDRFRKAKSADEQSELFGALNGLRIEFDTAATIVSIRHSCDTSDEFYSAEQKYMDAVRPQIAEHVNDLYRALISSPFRSELEQRWGVQLFRIAEMSVRCQSPEVLPLLQRENELSTEYQKLLASAEIPFDGKTLNLSSIVPYLQHTDRAVRKAASEAKWEFFRIHADELDRLYDELVHVRTEIAHRLGYRTFTELGYMRMLRSDYTPADVARYREYVLRHIVPIAVRLRQRQARRLGLERLRYYDEPLYYRSGNPTPKGDPDWIIAQARQMYAEMSPETGAFFQLMEQRQLMDLLTRPRKATGGYCTMLAAYGVPFIFANFNGTSHDVDVLTHEMGHAFQCYMSRHHPVPEYWFPTYEACEIHSMSMEFFAWPWIKRFFAEDEDKYQFQHLSGALLFLPYAVLVDHFQHDVYDHPTMTPAERKRRWRELEQMYLPFRDYEGNAFLEAGGIWQQQRHIYESPFYYIDYALAQVCALQFWVRAKTDRPGAWQDYLELCKAGGTRSFTELVALANLRSPFEERSFTDIVGDITARLEGVPDAHFD